MNVAERLALMDEITRKNNAEWGKMSKTLVFEGAGCAPRGDLENCRIRTAFTNDEGKRIYLEITGSETTKYTPERLREYENVAHVWHCFYITDETPNDDCNVHRIIEPHGKKSLELANFEYSRAGILAFVNANLHCSFESIAIVNGNGYRVFSDTPDKYNMMETEGRAALRRISDSISANE